MHRAESMGKEDFSVWNEEMAVRYDPDKYHRSTNWIVRWVESVRTRRIIGLLRPVKNSRVLEVGVGAGNILEKIPSENRTGIDLSTYLLDKARERLQGKATLVQGNAEELTKHFPPQSFDRIFCSEVLEHVQNPDKVMQEMASLLSPDGIVVVSVPNEFFINKIKSVLRSLGLFKILFPGLADHMEDEWHLHIFGRQFLTELCSRHFHVDRVDAVPFSFMPIRLVVGMRARRLPPLEKLFQEAPARHTNAGVPVFLPAEREAQVQSVAASVGENSWKNFFKRWPALYDFLVFLIGPCFFTGLTPRKFIDRFVKEGPVLNAGSGVKRISDRCLNVDLFAFPGVDVVADLERLPFHDGAFAGVTCDQVLEHVEHPQEIGRELVRVTKPGGYIHAASPFLFPWHPSPSDFTRWTIEGLQGLFPDCDLVQRGVIAGPFSALTAFMSAFLATILSFGSGKLRNTLQYVFLVLLAPLKFFDIVFYRLPGAELCAANFFVVVRKRHV